jgi:branched-chain amino acid transport system ATP-binding protein
VDGRFLVSNVVLEAVNLRKNFGGLAAVDGVDLKLEEGRVTGIMGPNGSGKTTLLNLLAGLTKPDTGKIYLHGKDVTQLGPHQRYNLGLARSFQQASLFNMSVLDNLLVADRGSTGESLFAPFKKWGIEEREAALRCFVLAEQADLKSKLESPSQELSGGQMKLLETARAMEKGSKVILLDEPVAGVLPELAHRILDTFRKSVKEQKLAAAIVEHRLEILFEYCDNVCAMDRGKIIAMGSPAEIRENKMVVESYLGA